MRWGAAGNTKRSFAPGLKCRQLHKVMRLLGACLKLTLLLRQAIRSHLRRAWPEKLFNVIHRIHLWLFYFRVLAAGRISLPLPRLAMSDELLGLP